MALRLLWLRLFPLTLGDALYDPQGYQQGRQELHDDDQSAEAEKCPYDEAAVIFAGLRGCLHNLRGCEQGTKGSQDSSCHDLPPFSCFSVADAFLLSS
jgi:hypothetical protein